MDLLLVNDAIVRTGGYVLAVGALDLLVTGSRMLSQLALALK